MLVIPHAGNWPTIGYGLIWFVAYCIGNKDRWHRFLVLLPIVIILVMSWWLLADGGVLSVIHAYREIAGTSTPSGCWHSCKQPATTPDWAVRSTSPTSLLVSNWS